jgi:transcription antitermination factor NusG
MRWFALTVKPQHEKKVSLILRNKGYEELLPLYTLRRRWCDRYKEVDFPLFAGYVFCRFGINRRSSVLKTPGVHSIVGFGAPVPVEEHEVQAIRLMMNSGQPIRPWPYLQVGERVRIREGSMEGLEGILAREKDAWRVVVSVGLLQRSIAVEIDRDLLTRAATVAA